MRRSLVSIGFRTAIAVLFVIFSFVLISAEKPTWTAQDSAYYLDANEAAFIRPGLVIDIQNVNFAEDGAIKIRVGFSDPAGAPLERDGITTPGVINASAVAGYIPAGQRQYRAYTTRIKNGNISGTSAEQATSDSGGVWERVSAGVYDYTFATMLPSGYDRTVTHTIGYVVKRFPRASETFIAHEILELERPGAEVRILTLWDNDVAAEHGWLRELEAPVIHCGATPLSDAWKWLHRRSLARPERAPSCQQALAEAFEYPNRRGRHRLREAVAVAEAALEAGVEHLHAHFANDPAFVAYLAHLASGLPFSFTAHAKDIYAKAPSQDSLRRVVDAASFAVTVTKHNQRELAARL
ncbi:MAG: hypothetical protein GY953_02510, partial [bacterium]|nr:hypothetical protein [bacterium]